MTVTVRPDSPHRGRLRGLAAVFTVGALALATATVAASAPVGVPVTPAGQVTGWGKNDSGQAHNAPTGDSYTAIAAGWNHSLALTADGHIRGWGDIGWGRADNPPNDGGYIAIAAGGMHSLALTADGHITSWGDTDYGQANNAPTGGGYTAIAAGGMHSLALTADGHITLWGDTSRGQANNAPTGGGYTAIATGGGNHSLALTADGHITSFGDISSGQDVGAPTDGGYTAIATGPFRSLALSGDGHITTWSAANSGQDRNAPTDGGYTAIAAGNYHSLALSADGHIRGWGYEISGQDLGAVPTDGGYTAIAAGDSHSVALNPQTAPTLTGTAPPAQKNSPYEYRFTVAGYPTPAVTATALPTGLTISADGVLSGTPTTSGQFNFILTSTNNVGTPATLPVILDINEAPAFVDVGPVPLSGIADAAFTHTFTATGYPTPTYTSSALPGGLTLDPTTGILSGAPSTTGPSAFTVTATNGIGNPATLNVTLDVAAPLAAPMFTDAGPVTLHAVTKTAFTREFTVTGNPTPTITVLDPTKLPTGMTFTDGALTGTPLATGTYMFTLTATNGVHPDLTLDVTVNVTEDTTTPEQPATGSLGSLVIFGFGS